MRVVVNHTLGKPHLDEFCLRWNENRRNNRKSALNESYIQEHLFDYFENKGHSGFLRNVYSLLLFCYSILFLRYILL